MYEQRWSMPESFWLFFLMFSPPPPSTHPPVLWLLLYLCIWIGWIWRLLLSFDQLKKYTILGETDLFILLEPNVWMSWHLGFLYTHKIVWEYLFWHGFWGEGKFPGIPPSLFLRTFAMCLFCKHNLLISLSWEETPPPTPILMLKYCCLLKSAVFFTYF